MRLLKNAVSEEAIAKIANDLRVALSHQGPVTEGRGRQKPYCLPATVCAAAVRLLAGLAGLAAAAAHHGLILVLVCLVLVVTVTVGTVVLIGHLYLFITFFIPNPPAKNLTQPYPQSAHQEP